MQRTALALQVEALESEIQQERERNRSLAVAHRAELAAMSRTVSQNSNQETINILRRKLAGAVRQIEVLNGSVSRNGPAQPNVPMRSSASAGQRADRVYVFNDPFQGHSSAVLPSAGLDLDDEVQSTNSDF